MTFVRAHKLSNIQVLKQSLNEIHSAILDATSTNRISARRHHNSNPKVSPNVSVGDHVSYKTMSEDVTMWHNRLAHVNRKKISAPYTPQSNGVAERMNLMLIESVRTTLLQSGLPK
jgi:hypothetical protein